MLVKDRMNPAVTIDAGRDYQSALALMREHGVRHLPVVSATGELTGLVVERDLVLAGTRFLQCPVPVSEVMQRDVLTIGPDARIADAAMRMVNHAVSGLPVVEENNRVIGILTDVDILRAFVETVPEHNVFSTRPVMKRRPLATSAADARKSDTHSPTERV